MLNDAEVLELGPRLGLLRAMHKILRIKPSGLLCCGLPCASWVFTNRATSGRRPYRIFGTTRYAYIKKANEHFGCEGGEEHFDCEWVLGFRLRSSKGL